MTGETKEPMCQRHSKSTQIAIETDVLSETGAVAKMKQVLLKWASQENRSRELQEAQFLWRLWNETCEMTAAKHKWS